MTSRRHIACEGAFNIRDLGGYPTAHGGTTTWRALYRADGLHRVAGPARSGLDELGWQTVLDLRTFAEVETGVYEPAGADVIHLPVIREVWDSGSIDVTHDAVDYLVERYLEMLDHGATAFAAAFDVLAVPHRRPAVFHCSAGKDRTGILAALILSVLGVPDRTIARDYALSAVAMDQILDWYRVHQPEFVDRMAQHPPQLLACPAEAMLEFLDRARREHGSVQDYLIDAGTTPAALEELRTALVDR